MISSTCGRVRAILLALSLFFAACAADADSATETGADPADALPDAAADADAAQPDAGAPPVEDTADPDVSATPDATPDAPEATCAHGCGEHGACVAGACSCDEGFEGERCDVCAEGRFGASCAACPCEHGLCLDGKDGTGACVCPAGFDGETCENETEPAVPWSDGPYGTGIMDTAEDFTVPTTAGPWTLSEQWSGHESYVFALRYAQSQGTVDVWNGTPKWLLKRSPTTVHYFFGALGGDHQEHIAELKGRMDKALVALEPAERADWERRIHYIDADAFDLPFVAALGNAYFAVDRFQRWREVGSLYDFVTATMSQQFLANEPWYFDYEYAIEQKEKGLDATVVTLFDGHEHEGGWGGGYSSAVTVALPPASEMAAFDSMAIYLYTACPDHKQGKDAGCNEWDYIQDLYVCDRPLVTENEYATTACEEGDTLPCACEQPDGQTVDALHTCNADGAGFGACACACGTELARWVTPYGREGRWLSDASPLLSLLRAGGERTFRFGGANGYTLDLRLLLWDRGTGYRPVEARRLWGTGGGEGFNLSYNDGHHADVSFELPDGATKAEVVAVISGHGHSSTKENCAEFCNHVHEFKVNGQVFEKTHPVAGTGYGCRDQVKDGTVPNQFGTWMLGRGGWCPGMDIAPWSADITPALKATNTISYRGLFNGADYEPTVTDPGGYQPEIKLSSWLVFYEAVSP